MRYALWIGGVLLAAGWAWAELPPSVYEQRQKAAPEHLMIEVQRVDIEPGAETGQQVVHVVAKVEKVHRSATGLEPGALITISYTVTERPRGFAGPGEVPILEELAKTVAFLAVLEDGKAYAPAAGVMSFSEF
ncbi:MAG: hypothetical protein N2322_03115 [Terrimicrobiaceae bacterium]|nr:hypothetical protein [Terrimicrobiaceae bacterium]